MSESFLTSPPSYLTLPDVLWDKQPPVPAADPKGVVWNTELAGELGIPRLIDSVWAGSEVIPGSTPFAQAYAGHQFGHFTLLGDGRAVVLGEHVSPDGRRLDIQLKGSGKTRYSRGGDGRAVLGPMLREYLISEAMHALGIPTTRSLSVCYTGEPVIREEPQPGAVLVRVASSHLRVGTFELAAQLEGNDVLETLTQYAIRRHVPEVLEAEHPVVAFLDEVMQRQARLMTQWMGVGFVHGVMNTDNMAISGETIDYGPCAFLDEADPEAVYSSIDQQGRYAFGNQPRIAHWNLAVLASALLPLLSEDTGKAEELAMGVLDQFPSRFHEAWRKTMTAKLGLTDPVPDDDALVGDLLEIMQQKKMDFTVAFLELETEIPAFLQEWSKGWIARCGGEEGVREARIRMAETNPVVIPRNYKVEEALSAAMEEDLTLFHELVDQVTDPFDRAKDRKGLDQRPPPGTPRVTTYCGT